MDEEPALAKRWFDAGEKFAKQGVLQGELAMAESLVTIARSLLELGKVYEFRDEDRPRALPVYRLASSAHSRLWFDTRRHAIHWEANRKAHDVMAESIQYQLRNSPDSELPNVLIRPGLYRRMLRQSPIRAREATVVDPLLRHNLERAGGWLEAIAKDSLTTDEEKVVLRRAAELLETWEVRESDRVRGFGEKESPIPAHPFGP